MNQVVIIDFNRTLYNPDNNKLEESAISVLEYLSTRAILILLGKGTESRQDLIDTLNIKKYFQKIIIIEEKNIEQLEAIKNQYAHISIFFSIGDRIKKEITLGNEMGFKTIWFKKGKFSLEAPQHEHEIPWKTVTSLKEIELYIN
ncbi:hypothetical protein IPJ72_02485 [Candidatus Peregrinibacteria bacterium]|nr:MAG: hypothetical protein IPJ72_02485 [Candidatus Peregrinibacteria bacterium]